MLSIVEAASKNKFLFYDKLQKELDVGTVREIEDLVIDCVYANLLSGKLDQRKKAFEVNWVMGRDLGPTEVDDMIRTIDNWIKSSDQLIAVLEEKIKSANVQHIKKKEDAEKTAKQKNETIENIKAALVAGDQDAIALALGLPPPTADQKGKRGKGGGGGAAGLTGMIGSVADSMARKMGLGGGAGNQRDSGGRRS